MNYTDITYDDLNLEKFECIFLPKSHVKNEKKKKRKRERGSTYTAQENMTKSSFLYNTLISITILLT